MTVPTWFYNEFQQVGTDFEDPSQIAVYDRNQPSSIVEAERALVARLKISPGTRVIDFGCGTGTFAIQSAIAGASVDAVDVSQTMLNYAQQKAQADGVETIQFHHRGFLTYEHQAEPVDLIVTKAAFHHLPDFWKMVALLRMATMLKRGGFLYLRDTVYSFPAAEYRASIKDWIAQSAKPDGGWVADDFETHIREEYTTFAWIIEGMLERAGFKLTETNYLNPAIAEYLCRK